MKIVRIGCGAGYSGDRIEPAVELAEHGRLDYLVFECLAERTLALAQRERARDDSLGYDPLLAARLTAVLPHCLSTGVTVITNMGAANPTAAAALAARLTRELGFHGVRIAAVGGDDVFDVIAGGAFTAIDSGAPFAAMADRLVAANAYLGVDPVLEALRGFARVVITGRVADPSLFLAPLIHEFGWAADDWPRLGAGTVVGHLLECAGQVTGGYFADPGRKDVANLARLGFPLAEVQEDGTAVITKVEGSGGAVTVATCTEQLLYEIHDPTAYITPDVIADFSRVRFTAAGPDRVAVAGAGGAPRPATLKVCVGYRDGFVGEGQIWLRRLGRHGPRAPGAGDRPGAARHRRRAVRRAARRPDRRRARRRAAADRRPHPDDGRRGPHRERSRNALHQWSGRWRRCAQGGARSAGHGRDPAVARSRDPRRLVRGVVAATVLEPKMKLATLAHGRAGDKGRIVNVSVIAFDPRDYPRLARDVTVERVRAQVGGVIAGDIRRYELPQLRALNFVMARSAGESVTRSLALDAHGKSLSSLLLDLELPE